MARKTFARTVVMTICDVRYIDKDNHEMDGEVVLFGDYDISAAQNAAIKKLQAKGGFVRKVKYRSFYGTMSIEDFAKYCDKKNFKEWE